MKPTYATLKSNFYSSNRNNTNFLDGKEFYAEMGIDQAKLIKQNKADSNTCAARLSLALIKSGVSFNGRMTIKSGPYKGKI